MPQGCGLSNYKDVQMDTLLKKEFTKNVDRFGPDPLLKRKQGLKNSLSRDILEYKNKINDEDYMIYAIDKIAVELIHFLVK